MTDLERLEARAQRADLDAFERVIKSLATELELLIEQRDQVLALLGEVDCSNCDHAVKLHDASPTGECTQDHMKTRACGCDWVNPLVEDIRAIFSGTRTPDPQHEGNGS